jgi:hypothetical protein
MIGLLALRHLLVRPGRAATLLIGYGLGVAVMIVLLSVGEAMLEQSRDVALVGGGDLVAIPEGLDLEGLRTGAVTGLFYGIDRARFVSRQMVAGPRHAATIIAASPVIEEKRLILRTADTTMAVRGGGEIPGAAASLGAGLEILAGSWTDTDADRAWLTPTPQQLYDELDRFHLPRGRDTTWGEWHYVNVVVSEREWWYITLLVGGDLLGERWGGQVLVTRRRPDGGHDRFTANVPRDRVNFDTSRADLTVGDASLVQRDGRYRLEVRQGGVRVALDIVPAPRRYFPPVELADDRFRSGYVVPALVATATGELCAQRACATVTDAPAYHDHNWGTWSDVTWEWGLGHGRDNALLYGGVRGPGARGEMAGRAPFFLTLVDSLGVRQVYRFAEVVRHGSRAVPGSPGVKAPDSLAIMALRGSDTVRVGIAILDVTASRSEAAGMTRVFLQVRGRWTVNGRVAGNPVSDGGTGFFETWLEPPSP